MKASIEVLCERIETSEFVYFKIKQSNLSPNYRMFVPQLNKDSNP